MFLCPMRVRQKKCALGLMKDAAPSGVTTLATTQSAVLVTAASPGPFLNCRTCLSGHAGWPRLALRGKAHACRMLAIAHIFKSPSVLVVGLSALFRRKIEEVLNAAALCRIEHAFGSLICWPIPKSVVGVHAVLLLVKPKHQPVALWFFVLALPGVPAPGLTYPLIGGASVLKDQG